VIKVIESPREAFQANYNFIPSELKVRYINALMRVGFDIIEVGSLVSPKAVPQVSDTMEVIKMLDFSDSRSKPMVLLVNKKGAEMISQVSEITHVCYPFPVCESFANRNLNSTIKSCLKTVDEILNISIKSNKTLIVYLSMAFGNSYGDEWSLEILSKWVEVFKNKGIRILPLSNVSLEVDAKQIAEVFTLLISQFPEMEFGLHLHTNDHLWHEKVNSAWLAGCRRFDGVINGMGGCPMTGNELLGNLKTENLIHFLKTKNEIPEGFDHIAFIEAGNLASEIFDGGNK
jgi:hydroxymethylglutaryl-CoA lyase